VLLSDGFYSLPVLLYVKTTPRCNLNWKDRSRFGLINIQQTAHRVFGHLGVFRMTDNSIWQNKKLQQTTPYKPAAFFAVFVFSGATTRYVLDVLVHMMRSFSIRFAAAICGNTAAIVRQLSLRTYHKSRTLTKAYRSYTT